MLLDSASLYFRAFHGVPESVTAPDGTPVNSVRGFIDMIAFLVRSRRPDRLVACLDLDWRPAFRVAAVPSYKAHRVSPKGGETVPDGLVPQIPVIMEVLDALGIAAVGADGFEADDVIGTIAHASTESVEVVSGDRDLFQVVRDPVVHVLYPLKGTSSLATMDGAGVAAKTGVPAGRYVDLAILRGDPSDGLPGVPGVGEKTAARLVADHPDLDDLLAAAAAGRLTPRLNAALTGNADYVQAMRKVAAVATDVDYHISAPHPPDRDRLAALAAANAIEGPVDRMLAALEQSGLAAPA
jgi:5'-3' exonuclease